MQISRSGLCSSDPRLTSAFCRAAWWTDDLFPRLEIQMYQLLSLNSKLFLRSPPPPAPPRLQGSKQPGRVRHGKVHKFINSIDIRDTFWEKKVLDQWKKMFLLFRFTQNEKGSGEYLACMRKDRYLSTEFLFLPRFNIWSLKHQKHSCCVPVYLLPNLCPII